MEGAPAGVGREGGEGNSFLRKHLEKETPGFRVSGSSGSGSVGKRRSLKEKLNYEGVMGGLDGGGVRHCSLYEGTRCFPVV